MELNALILNSFFAFLAGIALNFTPCVLPVIPIKIRTLLTEIDKNTSQRIYASLSLLCGSLAFFIPLSLAVSYLGVLWGEFFQSKVFLSFLSLFLFLSGLATIFNWSMNLPQFFYKMPFKNQLGAFFTGFLAGVLSTPCTGPFLGSVLAYTMTQNVEISLSIFFFIGIGISFPYILLLLKPKWLNYLPKSGQLISDFKNFLGIVLISGALFFGQTMIPQSLIEIAFFILAAGIICWLFYRLFFRSKLSHKVLPLLYIALIIFAATKLDLFSNEQAKTLTWHKINNDASKSLRESLKNRRPTFIEFTAAWCLNCKILEKTVYSDPKVVRAITENDILPIQFDMTDFTDEQKSILLQYKGNSLPYAVLIDKEGEVLKRFSGMFTVKTFIDSLELITQKTASKTSTPH